MCVTPENLLHTNWIYIDLFHLAGTLLGTVANTCVTLDCMFCSPLYKIRITVHVDI